MQKIKIGVSECLLGARVRYDGQHKHNHFITDTLGQFFEYVGVCPEVECGLTVPRESMRLVGDPEQPRLLTTRTKIDHTARMQKWAAQRVQQLKQENLHGFIFKARSPSSGMERVKVYNEKGGMAGKSPGLFAKAFMAEFPTLPCEEDGRLNDLELRENFVERVFTLWRFRQAVQSSPTLSTLMTFHAQNKYLIMAHNEKRMREMGRALAELKACDAGNHVAVYEADLMEVLKRKATVRKHTNILQHMLGFLREALDDADRQELVRIIEMYHQGLLPLIVPVTMLRHYVVKHDIEYLKDQYYLDPHPIELKLRNHA